MKYLAGVCLSLSFFALTSPADAATLTVNAGGDLQAAINAAQPGDTILIQAGAVFTGNFTLPAKGGSAFITIRSSAPDSSLPAAGVRISPSYASVLPKIRSTQHGAAFITVGAASYWRLQFLEILPSVSTSAANLIELGRTGSAQSSLSQVPHHLVIDRCYIHGVPSYAQRRGIALNSGDTQIVNSYISDIKAPDTDTQAIAGWNGPGPFLIENNHIEAAAENILFGGGDPSIQNLVPSNITIRRNLITKPLAWMQSAWVVKNLLELKNADTVLIEGNVIENNWASGQQGYAIVLTPRNSERTAPWSVVQNVRIQHNVIRQVAAVLNILGYDDSGGQSRQLNNVSFVNNLVHDVSTKYSTTGNPANGWFAVIGNGPRDLVFDHNTIDNDGNDTIVFYGGTYPAPSQIYGVVITNNLLRDNLYGIFGAGSSEGSVSLNLYAPGATVLRNAIAGADSRYPAGNDFPTLAQWIADFVNRSAADYRLVSTSRSKASGTDGKDLGVDFAALNAALSGSGATPPPPPPPPPSASSTPFTGTPIALPGRIEAEAYDKGGEGLAYHDTTSGNSSGAYRSDDVDIRVTTDASGSYNLKSVRATEWLAYTVNIATAGTYAIDLRIASSGAGGTARLAVDGVDVSGAITLPDTGGWNIWQTVRRDGVMLPAGTHVLRLTIEANGSTGTAADINWVSVSAASTPAPAPSAAYSGTPIALPNRIEAENYDRGGSGVAYYDTTSGNNTGAYRSDDVDIRVTTDTSGGYNLKSVRAGEWLAYSVNVVTAGTYALDLRVASLGGGGTVRLMVDGRDATGPIVLPNTGSWNLWQTVTKTGVTLTAGPHVFRLVIEANGSGGTAADINWLAIR